MAAPTAPGLPIQVTIKQRLFNQTILSIFYCAPDFQATSPDNFTEMQQIADYVADGATAGHPITMWRPLVSTDLVFEKVRVQQIFPRTPYRETLCGLTGSDSNHANTANTAAVVTKRTDLLGRRGRGDTHVAGLAAVSFANGLLAPGVELRLFNAMVWLMTPSFSVPGTGTTYTWSLAPVSQAFPTYPITDLATQPETRTMRRRTVGLGI